MIAPSTHTKLRLWSAWGGPLYVLLLSIGVWPLAQMWPPPAPLDNMQQIHAMVEANRNGLRLGVVFIMLACAAFIPFAAVLTRYTRKLEGHTGVLTVSMLLGAYGNVILTYLPAMWLVLHLYRPELSPELVYHGVGGFWLQFVGGITLFYPVLMVMAVCALVDKREIPLYPRWFGYFAAWNLVIFIPGLVAFFLYKGPFAWNGLLALWIPLLVFFVWFLLVFIYLRRAILNDAAEQQ